MTKTDPETDPETGLDADMAASMERQARLMHEAGVDPDAELSVADQRRTVDALAPHWAVGADGTVPEVEDVAPLDLPGASGPLRATLYRPNVPAPAGVVLYFHGGGWVKGSPEAVEWPCRRIAQLSGLNVIAPRYSLAPEAPWPAARDDALALLDWSMGPSARAGLDHRRVLVAGASAGAHVGLSAVMARRDVTGRDARASLPLGMAFFYGVFGTDFDTPSYTEFADGRFGLARADMKHYVEAYAAGAPTASLDLLSKPMAGLPPTWLAAAGKDVLRDDTLRLHETLDRAGVASALRLDEGLAHGYSARAGHIAAARASVDAAAVFLRDQARRASTLQAAPA